MTQTNKRIPSPIYLVLDTLLQITMRVTLGTRLCLIQALFTLMSGQLLESRGALIPALSNLGFDKRETQRIRQAIHRGAWSTNQLLQHFHTLVITQQHWQPLRIAGYSVNALDTTAIFRPKLQGCQTRHYHPMAGRCLPSTNFALLGSIGSIEDQKVTLLRCIARGDDHAATEEALMCRIAMQAARVLGNGETAITVADRKFNALELLECGHSLLVLRRARNMTFRRAAFTANTGRGRPVKHGEIIRPLERVFKGRTLSASPADQECTWVELDKDGQELVLHARIWIELVFFEQKSWSVERLALNKSSLWTVMTVKHPSFELPMLIVMNIPELTPMEACQVVKARWGIEQAPLVSKQLLGAHRLFVHNAEMCYRVPELVFVAGAILTYLAGVIGAIPTGWWDTKPRASAGRLRRVLARVRDYHVLDGAVQLRFKRSVTGHLPVGQAARRARIPSS